MGREYDERSEEIDEARDAQERAERIRQATEQYADLRQRDDKKQPAEMTNDELAAELQGQRQRWDGVHASYEQADEDARTSGTAEAIERKEQLEGELISLRNEMRPVEEELRQRREPEVLDGSADTEESIVGYGGAGSEKEAASAIEAGETLVERSERRHVLPGDAADGSAPVDDSRVDPMAWGRESGRVWQESERALDPAVETEKRVDLVDENGSVIGTGRVDLYRETEEGDGVIVEFKTRDWSNYDTDGAVDSMLQRDYEQVEKYRSSPDTPDANYVAVEYQNRPDDGEQVARIESFFTQRGISVVWQN